MLDERRKKILWAITQSHIDLNTPIGSSLITKRYPIGLSPATVRNIMASLEEMGYIKQPHTSAGRIPTAKGFKFYVNTLLEEQELTCSEKRFIDMSSKLQIKENSTIFQEATNALSILSHYMSVALPPKIEDMILKHIKFIKYDRKKILSVFMSEDGMVKNTFIELYESCSQRHLDKLANYLNTKFVGLGIIEIRKQIVAQLNKEKETYDKFRKQILHLFQETITFDHAGLTFHGLSGTSFLPDFVNINQVKQILRTIEENKFVLKLLNQISGSQGVQVFVGMESVTPAMKELSMVVSTYSDRNNSIGAIGIIGPTRMNYKRLIPIVDHTAKTLTQILSIS